MADPQLDTTIAFERSEDLAEWLSRRHATADELWVKVYKKGSERQSVTWNDIVVEALRWGWIDGMKRSLGDDAYLQRITPRRRRSTWSKRNREHAERLIAAGRMKPPGLRQVEAAKTDGRWDEAYAPQSEMTVPDDFVASLTGDARGFYETLNRSARYAIAYGLTTAKKPETRQLRFDKFVAMLKRGEEPGFGFKKSPMKRSRKD